MSPAQQDTLCVNERQQIKRILESNEMTMTQVVKDRLNVMRTLKETGFHVNYVRKGYDD